MVADLCYVVGLRGGEMRKVAARKCTRVTCRVLVWRKSATRKCGVFSPYICRSLTWQRRTVATLKHNKLSPWRIFAPSRKSTTWHKSATIFGKGNVAKRSSQSPKATVLVQCTFYLKSKMKLTCFPVRQLSEEHVYLDTLG